MIDFNVSSWSPYRLLILLCAENACGDTSNSVQWSWETKLTAGIAMHKDGINFCFRAIELDDQLSSTNYNSSTITYRAWLISSYQALFPTLQARLLFNYIELDKMLSSSIELLSCSIDDFLSSLIQFLSCWNDFVIKLDLFFFQARLKW